MSGRSSTRVLPSHLAYLRDLHLVEERQGDVRLFPHTDQLSEIYSAFQKEFGAGITTRIANTDHRADDCRKYVLYNWVYEFCAYANYLREDHLLVFPYLTPDRVTQFAILQHVQKSEGKGIKHSFRLYARKEFLPSVHLSGKQVAFASHVLDRYRERVTGGSRNIIRFLHTIFESPPIVMRPNSHGQAAVMRFAAGSVMVLPFEESDNEILFTTFLTVNEVNDLCVIEPVRMLHFHYGQTFTPPATPDVEIRRMAKQLIKVWNLKSTTVLDGEQSFTQILDQEKRARTPSPSTTGNVSKLVVRSWADSNYWRYAAQCLKDDFARDYSDTGRIWGFQDGIYGPTLTRTNMMLRAIQSVTP